MQNSAEGPEDAEELLRMQFRAAEGSPELLIQQLKYYGFNLVDRFEMIPQRFALILEEDPNYTGPKNGGKDEYGRDKDTKQKSSRSRKRGRRKSEDPMQHEGQEPDMFYDRKKK